MPARLPLTPEQYAAHIRDLGRARQSRYRQRRNVTALQRSNVTQTERVAAPPAPARHSVPPKTTLLPPTGGSPLAAAPKPNKSGEVIDRLRADALPDVLNKGDHAAIKACPLSPAQIVEAFGAAFRGEWGGDWLQENLNVQAVIRRYAGYLAWKQRPKGALRNGVMLNGTYAPPAAFQSNKGKTYRAPEEFSPEELEASDRERQRVLAGLPAHLRGKSRWRAG